MFGYVTPDKDTLEKAERDRYQAAYCGLCRVLGTQYGSLGRLTLTYDMTFISLLLGSLYDMPEEAGELRCPANPLRRCSYVITEATRFAADMNLIMAYYKRLDDWNDDHSRVALQQSKLLEGRVAKAQAAWPVQSKVVADRMAQLGEIERENELNPDIPANCFGGLMGELFVMREDEWTDRLRAMGAALGRFIYLMDACIDLRADIRKERYNPLIAQTDMDFTPMLTMLIGECTQIFESLPIQRDAHILRNILYAGVWVQYKSKIEGKDGRHDRSV